MLINKPVVDYQTLTKGAFVITIWFTRFNELVKKIGIYVTLGYIKFHDWV